MHKQIRTSLGRSSSNDGVGAMAADDGELDVLDTSVNTLAQLLDLVSADFDICLAGGSHLSGGGEFVFAIEHDEGDDRTQACRQLLVEAGFENVRVVTPTFRWLEDHRGSLRDQIRNATQDGSKPREVFVGKLMDGRSFVHVTKQR